MFASLFALYSAAASHPLLKYWCLHCPHYLAWPSTDAGKLLLENAYVMGIMCQGIYTRRHVAISW